MKYRVLPLIFFLVILSCNQSKKEYVLKELSLKNCLGKSKSFFLPSGWIKAKSSDVSYHGHIELIQYPDSSYVMILCAHQTEIEPAYNIAKNLHSRSEKINGTIIMYDNVPQLRKPEFDFAFDSMKK